MPTAWFIAPYKWNDATPLPARSCAMDDCSRDIFAEDGDWAESAVGGDQTIVRVRASSHMLGRLRRVFKGLSETEALRVAGMRLCRLVQRVPGQCPSRDAQQLRSAWRGVGFGLGWRLPSSVIAWCIQRGLAPGQWDDLIAHVSGMCGVGAAAAYDQLLWTGARLMGAFPSTGLLDNFDRADADTLGANWSDLTGQATRFEIASNQARADAGTFFGRDYWNVAQYGPDAEAWMTIAVKPEDDGGTAAPLVRAKDVGSLNNDLYMSILLPLSTGADTIRVDRVINDVHTVLGATGSQEFSNGDGLGHASIGTVHRLYRRSAGVWTELLNRDDSGDGDHYVTAGYIGLVSVMAVGRFDDFGGGFLDEIEQFRGRGMAYGRPEWAM